MVTFCRTLVLHNPSVGRIAYHGLQLELPALRASKQPTPCRRKHCTTTGGPPAQPDPNERDKRTKQTGSARNEEISHPCCLSLAAEYRRTDCNTAIARYTR